MININEDLIKLAQRYPFSLLDLQHLYLRCRKIFYPRSEAIKKLKEIIEFALQHNISLINSYEIQYIINIIYDLK